MRGVGCRARGVVGGREIGTGMGWDEWARAAGALSSQLWHGHGRRRDALHFVVSAAALRVYEFYVCSRFAVTDVEYRGRFAIAVPSSFTQSLCDCAFILVHAVALRLCFFNPPCTFVLFIARHVVLSCATPGTTLE